MRRLFGVVGLLYVMLAAAVAGAVAVGRTRPTELIAFAASPGQASGGVYLLDTAAQMTLRLVAGYTSTVGTEFLVSPQGDLFIRLCSAERCRAYVMQGTRFQQLPIVLDVNSDVVWSAEGQLALESCEASGCDIFLWDGETPRNLTNTPDVSETSPAWSADGRLAFLTCELLVCDDVVVWDGQNFQRVTGGVSPLPNSTPAWSADGRLAFSGSCTADGRCDVLMWDGSTPQNLTPDAVVGERPRWGSSGQLTFQSCTSPLVNCDLMLWNGVTVTNLTPGIHATAANPVWNSAGQLAFVTSEGIQTRMMLWDGTALHTIIQQLDVFMPEAAWSGDGQLVFLSCTSLGVCDLMLWDGTSAYPLLQGLRTTSRFFSWNDAGHLLFMACFDVTRDCNLMLWDGQMLNTMSETPANKYFPVWVP